MSRIIVIEGPDRVGKATQSQMLCDHITGALKKRACVVEVPIHDNVTYRLIYWMLRNGSAKKFPKTFQWLQVLNRWIFQSFQLVKLEHEYDYIIFDRWSPSTSVYGMAEGLDEATIDKMYRLLRCPDFTLVLLGKAHAHEAEDAYEKDTVLQQKVRDLYAKWVDAQEEKVHVVDCEKSKEKVAQEIRTILATVRCIPA
jgi:thymidylate kinase